MTNPFTEAAEEMLREDDKPKAKSTGVTTADQKMMKHKVADNVQHTHSGTFLSDRKGVFFRTETSDGEEKYVQICSPLSIDAFVRNFNGGDWGRVITVTDQEGTKHEMVIAMDQLSSTGEEVLKDLLAQGMTYVPVHKTKILAYLNGWKSHQAMRCVRRVGWHMTPDGKRVFIMPHQTIGDCGNEGIKLQSTSPHIRGYASSGTLEGWRSTIGKKAIGNSRMVMAISAAFAAPLLSLVGESSGGISIVGPSKIAKTALLTSAASVVGAPPMVNSWRMTDNALESLCFARNDNLLILDELGQVDAKAVGPAVYMISNGQSKGRATTSGGGRDILEWKTLLLSSGEVSLSDKMAEGGHNIKAGQEVRFADITADAGKGLGVFDSLPEGETLQTYAADIYKQAQLNYGTALPEFLRRLVEDVDADYAGILLDIQAIRDRFMEKYARKLANASAQVTTVAGRFSLIAAAGELARFYGVVPWEEWHAVEQLQVCFDAWLGERSGGTVEKGENRQALDLVAGFITAHGASRFDDPWARALGDEDDDDSMETNRSMYNRAGWKRFITDEVTKAGEWMYYFTAQAWGQMCKEGSLGKSSVAQILKSEGYLQGGAQTVIRVPGVGSVRVYCVSGSVLNA